MIEQLDMPETVFDRPTTFRAIRRYWYLILICAILGAACGAVFAFKRPPVYTANSRLSAISVNASNVASLSGSLQAAEELASTFARVVESTDVAKRVAKALNTTPAWAMAHVSGTPVPSSPFVTISANAATPQIAARAANAALGAVTAYARKLVSASAGGPALLAKVHAESIAVTKAQSRVDRLKSQAGREEATASSSSSALGSTSTTSFNLSAVDPKLAGQIEQASADLAQAQTQLNGTQLAYSQMAENQLGSRQTVTASPAVGATSDRNQVAQIASLIGLLAGGLIGLAAATAFASRSTRAA
jgi:capsular polysaccharide biosynthesis protein